ncbi:DNA replication and repair protein RecO [Tamilnaduibacter salinus]|uniref:DNA repair protein RecO n=1 Tax=Tamilnaduibacter salinus TaxID=1484056 RepID=A0A2A2I591_9GAMM|nr:DNA repair protein RecO [Tamilnaduibacter salinus]PAV27181.1 DNA repair protein RecO [Tamilnaduibacter salinus]PVY78985.1 DNA replication and repair protein RecO [Tamilnaduibacter salinus]
MTGKVEQEPGYVLHRRAWRETSLIVDLFTLNHGRMSVVARGANRPKSSWKAQLQPFQPLLLDWQGRSEMKTLTAVEGRPGPVFERTERLYCGFYLNELIQRLLPPHDPAETLFAQYIESLDALARASDDEPVLRRFEQALVAALGWGFEWDRVTDTDSVVDPDGNYYYDPEQGILAQPGEGSLLQGLRGDVLKQLADGQFETPEARRLAKRVMRVLIDHLLQGRPLHSRNLFTSWRGGANDAQGTTGD